MAGFILTSESHATLISEFSTLNHYSEHILTADTTSNSNEKIRQFNSLLQRLLTTRDLIGSRTIADSVNSAINRKELSDSLVLSDSYYLMGVYNLLTKKYQESIRLFNLSMRIRKKEKEPDERLAKTLYNLGIAYNGLGDFKKLEYYTLSSLEVEKNIYGESSPYLIGSYLSMVTAYIGLNDYEKALDYASAALAVYESNRDAVSSSDMEFLYSNIGVLYLLLADYTKAKIYLEKAESSHDASQQGFNDNYINLMNSMAVTYGALGFSGKSDEYYEKGISMALLTNSSLAYNIINSYAIALGNRGLEKRGEELLIDALKREEARFGKDSNSYFEILIYCADFLRDYNIDNARSLQYYSLCIDYLKNVNSDHFLSDRVFTGYSLSLAEAGECEKALVVLQSLLFNNKEQTNKNDIFENPDLSTLTADRNTLRLFKAKYIIIQKLLKKRYDSNTMQASALTAEYVVRLLDKVRMNISEEESRLILGDRYRESYLNAIRDFNILFKNTKERYYLEKAFEYLEKSKVAGLLASTRELKAVQLKIPSHIAGLEKNLQRDIGLLNVRIDQEMNRDNPDHALLNEWKDNLLASVRIRDSLVLVFEKNYPDYYAIKYNTEAIKLDELPSIAGREINYINYVTSDTLLYIFIANRKHQQLLTIPVDSSFFSDIIDFRSLLSNPSSSENAREAYEVFCNKGYELYKILIDPVRPFLISEKLLISPDNLMSYIPFETIPMSPDVGTRIMYNEILYLMNDFDISYTYSATLMAESASKEFTFKNKVIAFAPAYPDPIDTRLVLMSRQPSAILQDLPFARLEAEYITQITGGQLFENSAAKESVYKEKSGSFDIIHLAMHTILNDKDPMQSTLLFSPENDSLNDSHLKTYEIYGTPLKAKMVVLSSCNTGSGLMYSGEGILSMARGFIYAGSESVVMSMWEIEDRSGTEIVTSFYDNIKLGKSKSSALRKARISYLKKSDQLRSHPYFWSALVIYGNNRPLYLPKHLIVKSVVAVLIAVILIIYYFRKRRYSQYS